MKSSTGFSPLTPLSTDPPSHRNGSQSGEPLQKIELETVLAACPMETAATPSSSSSPATSYNPREYTAAAARLSPSYGSIPPLSVSSPSPATPPSPRLISSLTSLLGKLNSLPVDLRTQIVDQLSPNSGEAEHDQPVKLFFQVKLCLLFLLFIFPILTPHLPFLAVPSHCPRRKSCVCFNQGAQVTPIQELICV